LAGKGEKLFGSTSLKYFLYNQIDQGNFTDETLAMFSKLDDYDVLSAIKEWVSHKDKVLSLLSQMIVDRKLLRIEIQKDAFNSAQINKKITKFSKKLDLSKEETKYFVFSQEIKNQAYNSDKPIFILNKKGKLKDIAKASDQFNIQALTKPVIKHFICYPK
jgi:hypothetical protein